MADFEGEWAMCSEEVRAWIAQFNKHDRCYDFLTGVRSDSLIDQDSAFDRAMAISPSPPVPFEGASSSLVLQDEVSVSTLQLQSASDTNEIATKSVHEIQTPVPATTGGTAPDQDVSLPARVKCESPASLPQKATLPRGLYPEVEQSLMDTSQVVAPSAAPGSTEYGITSTPASAFIEDATTDEVGHNQPPKTIDGEEGVCGTAAPSLACTPAALPTIGSIRN